MLEREPTPQYSQEAWLRYRRLFAEDITALQQRLNQVLAENGDILPHGLRASIYETRLQIQMSQESYFEIAGPIPATLTREQLFRSSFQGMVKALGTLSVQAERLRDENHGVLKYVRRLMNSW